MASNLLADKVIGIDLGATNIKFGVVTTKGEIQDTWSIATNTDDHGCNIVTDIIESIQRWLTESGSDTSQFIGIGISSPGSIDIEAGAVKAAFNLGWDDEQDVGPVIAEALDLPVILDNDANVLALGERWIGAGEEAPDVLFILLDSGVGGGVVAASRLIHGVAGAAGEVGHICVDRENGDQCTCGHYGCLETVTSTRGIVQLAKRLAQGEAKDCIDTVDAIFQAALAGDEFCDTVVEKVAYYLGFACATVADILNPSFIVIGGGVTQYGEFFRARIEKHFRQFAFPPVERSTEIRFAALGESGLILGAANLALQLRRKMALESLR